MTSTSFKDLKKELAEFQDTLAKYINNKLDYMQQEITMLNRRIEVLETRSMDHNEDIQVLFDKQPK